MSRSKKSSNFFEAGGINEASMLAYLNNQLSAEEKLQFEKLLKEDPFAQEALEGLQASQGGNNASAAVTSINKKIRERIGQKEKKGFQIHWSNYAWAAVLIGLLIGIGFVLINFIGNRDSNIAMNKEESANTNLFETEQELKPADIPVTIIPDSIVSPQQIAADTGISTSATGNTAAAPAESASKVVTDAAAPATLESKKAEKPAAPAKTEDKYTVTTTATQKVTRGAIVEREEADKVTVISMDDAMKNFNGGNYKQASEQFDAILQQQPNNTDALYFGGISDYINGNQRKSEKNFDKLLKDGSKFTEGSKWYKANILIQKGKREEAKKLLDELSQTSGSYRERARKRKAELEF